MIYLLKVTAFNMPRLVRVAGLSLMLLVGLTYLWVFVHSPAPGYLRGSFLAAFFGSFVAAVGVFWGSRAVGWWPGAAICGLGFGAYIISRTLGLPGFPKAVGAWHDPTGTIALICEGLFLVLYASVAVGMNVAAPEERDWGEQDFFTS